MFMNEMTLLKKENEEQIKKLRYNDTQIIKDIMKNMSIFKVNSYDAQVIKRDLIGMAQEFELRGKTLNDAIGEDVKEFTLDIIKNSGGPCKYEILLNFLIRLSGNFFAWFLIIALGAYGGKLGWRVDPVIFVFYFFIVVLGFITEGLIDPVFNMEKGIKGKVSSIISVSLFIAASITIFSVYDKQNVREFNTAYIVAASGATYLITRHLKTKNINKLANDKKNFIRDLS